MDIHLRHTACGNFRHHSQALGNTYDIGGTNGKAIASGSRKRRKISICADLFRKDPTVRFEENNLLIRWSGYLRGI